MGFNMIKTVIENPIFQNPNLEKVGLIAYIIENTLLKKTWVASMERARWSMNISNKIIKSAVSRYVCYFAYSDM